MNIYNVNTKKQKQAFKAQTKVGVKKAGAFIKFCYVLTYLLRWLAVILGIATILYVIFLSEYVVDILFLVVTFGIPFLLSFIPQAVYAISLSSEYRFRRKETLTITDNGFIYAYHDDRSNLTTERFSYNVAYNKIDRVEYDEKTSMLTLYGSIIEERFLGGTLKEANEWGKLSLLNIYDVDVAKLAMENCQ